MKPQFRQLEMPGMLSPLWVASHKGTYYTLVSKGLDIALGIHQQDIDKAIALLPTKTFRLNGELIKGISTQNFSRLLMKLAELPNGQRAKYAMGLSCQEGMKSMKDSKGNLVVPGLVNLQNMSGDPHNPKYSTNDIAKALGVTPEEMEQMLPEIMERLGK